MRGLRPFAAITGTALLGAALALAVAVLWQCDGSLRRAVWIGRPLLEVQLPVDGDVIPQGGLLVRVTYPEVERVAAETFQCELNGEDVTARVGVRAENGVDGAIYPLREGRNHLRIGVFGRSFWGSWVEDVVEIEIHTRPMDSWNRA